MDDFRRYPKGASRQLIDYNRFLSLTGEKLFVCLDRGILEICRYFINSRGRWRTTYYVDNTDDGYYLPTEEQFITLEHAIAGANIDMSNCEEIVEALNGIRDAIAEGATETSSGCGCVGSGDDDITGLTPPPSESIPGGSSVPPGFSNRSEYDEHRCGVARKYVEDYIQTLRNWATLSGTVAVLTVAVMVGLSLLVLPPIGIMVVLGALGALVAIDVGLLSNLSLIADAIEEDIDTVVCHIYSASSTEAAVNVFRTDVQAILTELDLDTPETYQLITDNMVSTEQMNGLNDPAAETAAADCSECLPDIMVLTPYSGTIATLIDGDFAIGGNPEIEAVVSTGVFGFQKTNIQANFINPDLYTMAISSFSGAGVTSIIINTEDGEVYSGSPGGAIGVEFDKQYYHIINTTGGATDSLQPFTIIMDLQEV